MDISSKLANNSKLTSDKYKKCLYCGTEDHKLDSYSKKQTTVMPKDYDVSATADPLIAASKKLLEK